MTRFRRAAMRAAIDPALSKLGDDLADLLLSKLDTVLAEVFDVARSALASDLEVESTSNPTIMTTTHILDAIREADRRTHAIRRHGR